MIIDNNGHVYGIGYNLVGQLGLGFESRENPPIVKTFTKSVRRVTPFIVDNECKAKSISCGRDFCIYINQNNEIYGTGHNNYG